MEVERKSSTTAKTALGLSIGALGLELLGNGGGGILSGLLNRGGMNVTPETIITPGLLAMINGLMSSGAFSCGGHTRCSELESELAKEKAERYADKVATDAFKESQIALEKANTGNSEKFNKIFDELVANRIADVRTEERLKCLEERLNAKIDAGDQALANAIAVESERRMNGDNQIRDWVACNYVPWKRVLDSSLLCPPVQLATSAGGASNAQPSQVVVSGTVTTQAAAA